MANRQSVISCRTFLVDCASSGTTVVITTHFMEEADKADRIGFMRGGRVLVEGAPAKIKSRFGRPSLDDVFLALCLGPNSIEKVWLDFWLEKPLEFWLEIPYNVLKWAV